MKVTIAAVLMTLAGAGIPAVAATLTDAADLDKRAGTGIKLVHDVEVLLWHKKRRSHWRRGSEYGWDGYGGGWHDRWRSHYRWGSHGWGGGGDWHERWRSHWRWGSQY